MKILILSFFAFIMSLHGVYAQVRIEPGTATQEDAVTVFFDATEGSRGLFNCDCDVYIHTGLVTSASTSNSDWQFVPTQWGVTNDAWRMTPVGPNLYAIDIDIPSFYGVSASTDVNSLVFVMRDASGSRTGKSGSGSDLLVALNDVSNPNPNPPNPNPNPPNPDPDPNPNNPVPSGTPFGYTDLPNAGGVVKLLAPLRSEAYVIGSFNNFQVQEQYKMTPLGDGSGFQLELPASITDQDFAYQYVVDGAPAFADPFADLVLDPQNDGEIDGNTFPNLPSFSGLNGKASWVRERDFNWRNDNTARTPAEKLVIYELLVRDFSDAHSFQAVLESLDYLADLGVTAIELMPVNEFEFNNSWGYNPIFHGAIDKYYGTPESLKRLIDAAHGRGIRVIFDVVYNHAFPQNPWVDLYQAERDANGVDPFFNKEAPHPFAFGVDFNHESPYTQTYVKETLRKVMSEYHLDGIRFDLTKGFTQRNTANNEELERFDQNRVNVVKSYADAIRTVKSDAVIILEHLGGIEEETVWKDYGLYLWERADLEYAQNAMGYEGNTDLYGIIPQSRGWSRGIVGYMESHDEERQRFKVLEFGNTSPDLSYFASDETESLARMEATTMMFYTGPGTRMLWMFGEFGYPISIDEGGRTSRKPILWNLLQQPANRRLYDVTSAMIKLRNTYPVFTEGRGNLQQGLGGGLTKSVTLTHPDLDIVTIANFDVVPQTVNASFPRSGTYYDYFSGQAVQVGGTSQNFPLAPGDYRLLTSNRLPSPNVTAEINPRSELDPLAQGVEVSVFPNPASEEVTFTISDQSAGALSVEVYNSVGQLLLTRTADCCKLNLKLTDLASGTYTALVKAADGQATVKSFVKE